MNNNLRTLGISWHEVLKTAEDSQSWSWRVVMNNLRTFGISWHEVRETAEDGQSWSGVMNNNLRTLGIHQLVRGAGDNGGWTEVERSHEQQPEDQSINQSINQKRITATKVTNVTVRPLLQC